MVVAGLTATTGCGDPPGPAADYTISLNPTSASVAQGGNTTVQVTLARSGGFAGTVTLSLEAAPSGVEGTFSPMAPTGNTSTLTITVGSSVAAGTYPLTVKGAASGVSDRTASFSLTVTVAPGYTIVLNPTNASVAQGGNVAVQVTLTRTGGFTGAVALTLENAPAEVTGVFDPTPAPGESSILTVSVGGAATPGQYPLIVRGAGSGLADRTATLALTVTASGAGTVASVVAASLYSCALDAAGQPYCWGNNVYGRLGAPSTETCFESTPCSTRPVAVTGGLTFTTLSGLWGHICGLTAGGAAYCWGTNWQGELGDGTTTPRAAPTPVAGDLKFASISAGSGHTCGLTSSGAAYCWGGGTSASTNKGQLGDGTTEQRLAPTPVAGGLSFGTITAGDFHTCGITTTGAAYCWGQPVGDGSTTARSVPTAVAGGLTFARISAGSFRTCGVTTAGEAYCWGENSSGELGDGTRTNRLVPTRVAGDHTFTDVRTGYVHTCGVSTSGAALCWGRNTWGALGVGNETGPEQCELTPTLTVACSPTPLEVAGGHSFSVVSPSSGWPAGAHTCGVTRGGLAYCWGAHHYGQVGDGTIANGRLVPTPVAFP
jgi:alpha-tubulin suppressor-like RCC1 family protein